jgi:hypothetical protein
MFTVSLFIPFSLFAPIIHVAKWRDSSVATLVQVPETTVNKDDFAPRDKDQVWLSGKVGAMERVAIT